MFCDLVGSSVLGEQLDPEDLREVIRLYHDASARAIEGFQGHIGQYLGDGILAYFSYPRAHEDDAERAVRAAMAIVLELERINPDLERERGVRLAARIGIHTGLVVVGELGGGELRETLALGHTVNVAARLQEIAPPNSVVISGDALRLVRGLFVTEELGPQALLGISEPVTAHRVVRSSGVVGRIEIAGQSGLTPLVGREEDIQSLLDRFAEVRGGRGQVVLISGEPGIGKSRLLHALRGRLAEEPHTWVECRASPYHQNSALHPVIERLRLGFGVPSEEPAEEVVRRLERGLAAAGLPLDDVLPILASLLSLSLPPRYESPVLSSEAQRRKTLDIVAAWLVGLARLRPMILVVEDLHWLDPSSLELLGKLLAETATAALLLIATYRPGFDPPWAPLLHVTKATLGPLKRSEASAMVRQIVGGRDLPPGLLDQLVDKTDGVPLFIEELTKSVLESEPPALGDEGSSGCDGQPGLAIPSTLQASLAARLDRLGAAKEVAQFAAMLGREFSLDILSKVSSSDPRVLALDLEKLSAAGLLYRTGERAGGLYAFKHALIQEAAYQSLLRSTRRIRHQRIARVLEEHLGDGVESEVIARHYEEGGMLERAITHYQRAAESATQRSENAEAIAYLKRALELLERTAAGAERDERELPLQGALGALLVAACGWGSHDAEQAYGRARELCQRIGETPRLFQAVRGLVTFHTARAELDTATGLCERLLGLAQGTGDAAELLVAHQQTAISLYFSGRPEEARAHFERALSLYDPVEHRALRYLYGEDFGVFIRIWMAWDLWLLGQPDQAVRTALEAVGLGSQASHPFSLAYAVLWAAVVHVMRRERDDARALAEQAIAISNEQGFAFVLQGGRLVRAWSRLDAQRPARECDQAIAEIEHALGEMASTGTKVASPMIFGVVSDSYLEVGRRDKAWTAVHAALGVSSRTSQHFWDAELRRIEAEIWSLEHGATDGHAERLLLDALDLARSQGAKSLELRVATSLCRLWEKLGRRAAARDLLEPLHGAFREGVGTPDLKQASALLEKLA
jgi:class 3 adenylate cyclase/predicted ATPase